MGPQRRRSVPVPEPNLNNIASLRASSMMSSMLSLTLWMKQPSLRKFVVLRLTTAGLLVPMPIALRPLDAVLVIQTHVEPDGRIERPVLVQAQPRQLAVESLAVRLCGEVAVGRSPIGDRAADAVDQLTNALVRSPVPTSP